MEYITFNYFNGHKEGYLVIFRVYDIVENVPERLLFKGRQRRNFYYGLSEEYYANSALPTIDPVTFDKMKAESIDSMKQNGWLLDIIESTYDIAELSKHSTQDLINEEMAAYTQNKELSLSQLRDEIITKNLNRGIVVVEHQQYYRDSDVSCFAQKRANGICECCEQEAPFTRDDGKLFLETHHLTPLSEKGLDSIDNVCDVCPNCHRELHYGVKRKSLAKKIRDKIVAHSDA